MTERHTHRERMNERGKNTKIVNEMKQLLVKHSSGLDKFFFLPKTMRIRGKCRQARNSVMGFD